MIDIETLGAAPGSVILSIGAVTFDAETGALGADFYSAIDPQSAVDAGLRMDVSTLKWWMTQSDDARHAVFAGSQPLDCALREFSDFAHGADASRVWAKPPSFDLVLLEAAFQACRLHVPWHYRSLRDVRTLLDFTGTRPTYVGTAHNALDDARSQALSVIDAYRNAAIRTPNVAKDADHG
ncbi:3'-5' exonuclease [Shinella zoogloeoides]|uniref:3'-5' exonuclease n=1 Tax=Shinella zoogloeoides TaxID=352475 RepID=UPI001F5AA749|nr:3'-5' exonuclease [Shinella zoogloeoides]